MYSSRVIRQWDPIGENKSMGRGRSNVMISNHRLKALQIIYDTEGVLVAMVGLNVLNTLPDGVSKETIDFLEDHQLIEPKRVDKYELKYVVTPKGYDLLTAGVA